MIKIFDDGNPDWVEGLRPFEAEDGIGSSFVIKRSSNIKTIAGYSDAADEAWRLTANDWGMPGGPVFTHAFVDDYDNFNRAWSGGDVIKLSFDRTVDHGRKLRSGGKKYVDSLFGFTHRLGDSYSGAWSDDSTFIVTAITTEISRLEIGKTKLSSSRLLFNKAATSSCCAREVVLSGDFGHAGEPRLIGFEASDPMQNGPSPGSRDVIKLRFDRATDMAGLQLNQKINKGEFDRLFVFSAPGSDAFANAFGVLDPSEFKWTDSSTFQIDIGEGDPTRPSPMLAALAVGRSLVSMRALDCENVFTFPRCVRSKGLVDAGLHPILGRDTGFWTKMAKLKSAQPANVTMSGSLGTLASPELVAFVPNDPDDASAEYGCDAHGCDAFTLQFDMYTNWALSTGVGGVWAGTKAQVDALFGFSSNLGADYTGAWSDCLIRPEVWKNLPDRYCRSFTITLMDATLREGELPPTFGRTLAWVKPPDNIAEPAQPNSYMGIRTPAEKSPPSISVRALGTCSARSQLCKSFPASARGGTATHVQLDIGRSHLVYLELPEAAERPIDQMTVRELREALEARGLASAGLKPALVARLQDGTDLSSSATSRQCSMLPVERLDAQLQQPMQSYGGLQARQGSCSDASHARDVPTPLACGALGEGCGTVLQRALPRVALVRPPGAPREGNTTVNLLGSQLGSVVLCQFIVQGADDTAAFGTGLAAVVPYDDAGLSCPVPPLDPRHAQHGHSPPPPPFNTSGWWEAEANATLRAEAGYVAPVEWYPAEGTRLRVSDDGQHFSDVGLPFVYFSAPTVSDNRPVRGPTTGSFVSVHGLALDALLADASAARCKLGEVKTAVQSISADGRVLVCRLPPMADGMHADIDYPLEVALDGLTFVRSETQAEGASEAGLLFRYYVPPG